ncbi:MAG: RNA polymerase sigma factor [Gammaproteobacteria bacterium]|nr:MAG: RNA polymerase sigma factor [Gammaproteobacteria bacterium]
MEDELQLEQQLVRRMLQGDERAFNRFFDDYYARLYRFVLPRLNGDSDAAEEVTQASMIKAMERLDGFRGEARLFTWLCQISRRQLADFLRAGERRSRRVILIDDSPAVRTAVDSVSGPEQAEPAAEYSKVELSRQLQSVLDRLPANYGNALEWKYVEGLSVAEIGKRLGITTTATQSLLARARNAFRNGVESVFGTSELAELIGRRFTNR